MKIFISYSRKNSACAEKIVRQLEAQGYDVWFDQHSIPGGEAWLKFIRDGVRASGVTLLLWSQPASESDYVKKEYELALAQEIPTGMKIIQLMLDDTELSADLRQYQALTLKHCSNPEINDLLKELQQHQSLTRRQSEDIQPNRALQDYENARHISGAPLAIVPFMRSAHSEAFIVGEQSLSLADIRQQPAPVIQLILQFLGNQDDKMITQVYHTVQTWQEIDNPQLPPTPFFALYVTGKPQSGKFMLNNERPGEWLDAINTIYEAPNTLVGRGGALLQVFTAMPAAMAFVAGRPFCKYWHYQVFNYLREEQRRHPQQYYQSVMDSRDLGQRYS